MKTIEERIKQLEEEIDFLYLYPPAHPSKIRRKEKELRLLEMDKDKDRCEHKKTKTFERDRKGNTIPNVCEDCGCAVDY